MACAIVGCFNSKRKKTQRFFRIPAIIGKQGAHTHHLSVLRRKKWLVRVRRLDLFDASNNATHIRVCSDHFITGSPSALYDFLNPDWVPSIRLGDGDAKRDERVKKSHQRYLRYIERRKKRMLETYTVSEDPRKMKMSLDKLAKIKDIENRRGAGLSSAMDESETTVESEEQGGSKTNDGTQANVFKVVNQEKNMQTFETGDTIACVSLDNKYLSEEVDSMTKKLEGFLKFDFQSFEGNSAKTMVYTGLSWDAVNEIYATVKDEIRSCDELSQFDMLLATLMRLRLNVEYAYLAIIFPTTESVMKRVFLAVLEILYRRLLPSVTMPEESVMLDALSFSFKKVFPRSVIIVDILENIVDPPTEDVESSLYADTVEDLSVKCVVAVTTYRAIVHVSEPTMKNGNMYDLIESSDLINVITPFDHVLINYETESGVTESQCGMIRINSEGVKKFVVDEKIQKKITSRFKLNVSRIAGHLKRKFNILNGSIPYEFRSSENKIMKKIITVCCALNNISSQKEPA